MKCEKWDIIGGYFSTKDKQQMVGGFFLFFFVTLAFALLGLWIYALVDAIQSEYKESSMKAIWIILIIVFPFLGTILYFALAPAQKIDRMNDSGIRSLDEELV